MFRNISWMEYFSLVLSLALIFNMGGCDKKPIGIIDNEAPTFPDPPANLRVTIGSGQVLLEWDEPGGAEIRIFKVFRADSASGEFAFLDSTDQRRYLDRSVQNGQPYFYKVSAVNLAGFESRKSAAISAVPNSYSIAIENGSDFTATRHIVISITAPPNTAMMMLSNDSAFGGAVWVPVKPSTNWSLTTGDGVKTVYARFRDADGHENFDPVKDTIILDTRAEIASVTEDTNGQPKKAGDVIHFTLVANEPDGKASVSIEGGPQALKLYDNGTNGDSRTDDGIYELDYLVGEKVDVYQAKVWGSFIDRVQNVADDVFATTILTVLRAPDPVTLYQPYAGSNPEKELNLAWSISQDTADFSNYTIYRSRMPNVSDSTGDLVHVVNQRTTTVYLDSDLTPSTTYYYCIYVTDITGLRTKSNVVSGRTANKNPPLAVSVFQPLLLSDGRVQVTWTQSNDLSFASYRVYRSKSTVVDTTSILRAIIDSRTETSYFDSNLETGLRYYYRVYVFDKFGQFTGSNTVSVDVPKNEPPQPVLLSIPALIDSTRLLLTWTPSNDGDFSHYKLYRSLSSPVDSTAAPIAVISSRKTTEFTDRGLTPRTRYYYRVFVVDTGGLESGSNEVVRETR